MREKFIEAMKAFEKRNHRATITANTERFLCIDWKRSDGSGEYAVYYVLDKEKGRLCGYGDLGDFIASWFNRLDPVNLFGYVKDVGYFASKFETSSDLYEYNKEKIREDVADELKLLRENYEYELEEAMGPLEYPDYSYQEMEEEILQFDGDWDDLDRDIINQVENLIGGSMYECFGTPGREYSMRVYLWAAGYYMAINQLIQKGEV